MSSGWLRDSVFAGPLPFGWNVCFSVVPSTIWLTASPPAEVDALALAELAPVLAEPEPVLAVALEVELELELEHPDVPSRAAAATVTPSQVTLRMLEVFMRAVVRAPDDTTRSGATREHGLEMTRKQLNSAHLVKLRLADREVLTAASSRPSVFHQQTTNVSILSFMQRLWGLAPLTPLNARQNDLMSAFDFQQHPLAAPSPPVAPADTIGFHGNGGILTDIRTPSVNSSLTMGASACAPAGPPAVSVSIPVAQPGQGTPGVSGAGVHAFGKARRGVT